MAALCDKGEMRENEIDGKKRVSSLLRIMNYPSMTSISSTLFLPAHCTYQQEIHHNERGAEGHVHPERRFAGPERPLRVVGPDEVLNQKQQREPSHAVVVGDAAGGRIQAMVHVPTQAHTYRG